MYGEEYYPHQVDTDTTPFLALITITVSTTPCLLQTKRNLMLPSISHLSPTNPRRLQALNLATDSARIIEVADSIATYDFSQCQALFRTAFEKLESHPELATEEAARTTLSALYQALDLAVVATKQEQNSFTEEQVEMSEAMQTYLKEGAYPLWPTASVAAVMIEIERHEEISGEYHLARPADYLARFKAILRFIIQNPATSDAGRQVCNLANILGRNVASVALPTFIRQAISYSVEEQLNDSDATVATRTALATMVASLPIVLNLIGAAQESYRGTSTKTSTTCRALNILLSTGGIIAAAMTGVLPALAPSLVAFTSYCILRDLIQSVVSLKDNMQALDWQTAAISGGAYSVNQFVFGVCMDRFGSPSGAGAAAMTHYLDTVVNDLIRAGFNLVAETIDEFVIRGVQHYREGRTFHITLRFTPPTLQKCADLATRTIAARASLFTGAVMLGSAASAVLLPAAIAPIVPTSCDLITSTTAAVAKSFSPLETEMVQNALMAVILGAGYPIFIGAVASQARPPSKFDDI